LDTVYSIQVILIKLAVAIAFCIADYKGNEGGIFPSLSKNSCEQRSAITDLVGYVNQM
jgi:hypothetical protein